MILKTLDQRRNQGSHQQGLNEPALTLLMDYPGQCLFFLLEPACSSHPRKMPAQKIKDIKTDMDMESVQHKNRSAVRHHSRELFFDYGADGTLTRPGFASLMYW